MTKRRTLRAGDEIPLSEEALDYFYYAFNLLDDHEFFIGEPTLYLNQLVANDMVNCYHGQYIPTPRGAAYLEARDKLSPGDD